LFLSDGQSEVAKDHWLPQEICVIHVAFADFAYDAGGFYPIKPRNSWDG
jgi:hypothetical protein